MDFFFKHLLGEDIQNIYMESDTPKPESDSVKDMKPHEKSEKFNKATSAWRVYTKHLHGEWEPKTCWESECMNNLKIH